MRCISTSTSRLTRLRMRNPRVTEWVCRPRVSPGHVVTDSNPLAEALKPTGLGDRGAALWRAFGGDNTSDGARAVMIAEAARMADQLEQLDAFIRGDVDAWAKVEIPGSGKTLVLKIDGAVSERRQSMTVFRHLIGQLTSVASASPASSGTTPATEPGGDSPKGAPLDELAKARAERRATASNS